MRDAVRLALGTLTVLPVRPPQRVDRRTAGRAMVLAPLVGLLLGGLVAAALRLLDAASARPSPLLAAALGVAAVAVLTRGMHLDGLADTADGLGSGKPAEAALAVMRGGDVGPFGVAALTLTLLLQVAALSTAFAEGRGPGSLVVALVVSRTALPLVCLHGVPAARADGLGSSVAGSVSRAGLLVAVLLAAAAVVATSVVSGGPGSWAAAAVLPAGRPGAGAGPDLLWPALSTVLPLLLAALLARRCVRRLGGVTGDVLGACVEVACTAALVLMAFG